MRYIELIAFRADAGSGINSLARVVLQKVGVVGDAAAVNKFVDFDQPHTVPFQVTDLKST